MNYARIENGVVLEVINFNPDGCFHPSLTWVGCSDDVLVLWLYDGTAFTAPVIDEVTE